MNSKERFLAALQRKKTDRPAIGTPTSIVCLDLMDKLGVYFPEGHLKAESMAALASAGHTLMGFDNVMPLFSVCHESAAVGVETNWGEKSIMPSTLTPIWKEPEDIKVSKKFLDSPFAQTPLKAIRMMRKEFGENVAITGKAFGPWTLAYHLVGMEDFLMGSMTDPEKTKKIIAKLKEITVIFMEAQIDAGADNMLVADHATRDLCSPEAYRDFVMPIHKELAAKMKVPTTLHICGYTLDRIKYINETGLNAFHYDSKNDDDEMRKAASKVALLGGTNNTQLLRSGTEEDIVKDIEKKLKAGIDVIGPECAIPLDTPLKNMMVFGKYFKAISF